MPDPYPSRRDPQSSRPPAGDGKDSGRGSAPDPGKGPGRGAGRGPGGPGRAPRPSLWLVFLGIWLAVNGWSWWTTSREVATIPYSQFEAWLDADRIGKVTVAGDEVSGELKDPAEGEKPRFRTVSVPPELSVKLRDKGVEFTGVPTDKLFDNLFWTFVPLLVIFGVWMWFMRRMAAGGPGGGLGGGLMGVGKSRAKIYAETDVKVTFKDVAGVDEAKQELEEIIGFLKDPTAYGRLGARLPKGILLVGPPGTGKTLLARAVAGEASVPFFSISGSEFVEMFVGVGAARVRDLFEQARKRAPCIIFIDELDALGRARGAGPMSGGHDEKEQTLNQLLVELDGFDTSQGVVLLAATNRPEILDPALLRAGRFDRQILVDRPDKQARVQILGVHLRKVNLGGDVNILQVAALTPGFTGADLANLVNEAAILATRRRAPAVEMEDFQAGIERIIAGLEKKNRLLNPQERRVVAYHEMGHALVAKALPSADPVHKISIIPRGIGALGYTIQRPTDDRYLMSRQELLDKMAVLLGGRAAEQVVFGEVSTGAADDLSKVSNIARSMVARFGMDGKLGLVAWEDEPRSFLGGPGDLFGRQRQYSEDTARDIDVAVQELVAAAFESALGILQANRDALEQGATRLLAQETMLGEELPEVRGPPGREGAPATGPAAEGSPQATPDG